MMNPKLKAARIETLPDDAFYIPNFITEGEEKYLLQKISSSPLPRWTNLSHRRLQSWPSQLITTANSNSNSSKNQDKDNALISAPLPPWLVSPIITPRLVEELGVFANSGSSHKAPNHVLVNEYRPGQGIMPHEDGGAYFPVVATVSLGSVVVLDFYKKRRRGNKRNESENENLKGGNGDDDDDGDGDMTTEEKNRPQPQFRILQEPRSLLVTRGKMYTDFLHGIADTNRDEDLRRETICNWDLLGEPDSFASGWSQRGTRTSLTYREVLKVVKLGNAMKFLCPR